VPAGDVDQTDSREDANRASPGESSLLFGINMLWKLLLIRHCEARSAAAISNRLILRYEIATLRSQ
jgi:hypothetical protein